MKKNVIDFENLVLRDYNNIAGIVVLKNGLLAYENYFSGFTDKDTVHVASVTKSIISALIGIAIEKNHIKSIDQQVLDFFPDYTPKRGEKTIQNVTIKHLLTMTSPYKYKSEPYTKVYSSDDWTKAALDLLGGCSGITGNFMYSTVGTQILSGILTNATGQSVVSFASNNIFEPLGIKTPHTVTLHNKEEHMAFLKDKHVSGWVVDPKGVNTAGWGLCFTPTDMAKIGQLYLNNGLYQGKQILSPKWIENSTTEKSRWGEAPYGYLWWIVDYNNTHCYAAIGDGGNIIFVDPKDNMIAAIAASFKIRPKLITKLITEHIIPMFK